MIGLKDAIPLGPTNTFDTREAHEDRNTLKGSSRYECIYSIFHVVSQLGPYTYIVARLYEPKVAITYSGYKYCQSS